MTAPALNDLSRMLDELSNEAIRFIAHDKADALMHKWIARVPIDALSEDRMLAMMADTTLLATDLLASQPSASGGTAFDRMAKAMKRPTALQAAALVALARARYRLLLVQGASDLLVATMRDAVSGETVKVFDAELPKLPEGTPLFARCVPVGDDLVCLPGMVTPLDPAAFAVARGHAPAGAAGPAAGVRWAEAVYAHVVRHGTLDVPGVNRPREGVLEAEEEHGAIADDPHTQVLLDWVALGDAEPGADLLRRTRHMTEPSTIVSLLAAAAMARDVQRGERADVLERMLLVLLETVWLRERAGSGDLSLDGLAADVARRTASGELPAGAAALFASVRQSLAKSGARHAADDPALERLVQRIQALRAKTVAQGCTEQEALAAAEKVAELLDRYGLSLSELDVRAQPCEGVGIQTTRRRAAPIDECVPAIARYFDCRVWTERAKGEPIRYVFFGVRGDVSAAHYLYDLVERAFATETEAFRAGPLYARVEGDRRTATNSFQIGMARGIAGKLAAMRAARDAHLRSASGRDLVPVKAALLDEEFARLGLDLQTRGGIRSRQVLSEAFQQGEAAGRRFDLIPGIANAA